MRPFHALVSGPQGNKIEHTHTTNAHDVKLPGFVSSSNKRQKAIFGSISKTQKEKREREGEEKA
jgi:hypothetical protein